MIEDNLIGKIPSPEELAAMSNKKLNNAVWHRREMRNYCLKVMKEYAHNWVHYPEQSEEDEELRKDINSYLEYARLHQHIANKLEQEQDLRILIAKSNTCQEALKEETDAQV